MTYKKTDNYTKNTYNNDRKPKVQQPFGNKVIVIDGNVEFALRKFKKKIQNSGLLDDIKKKEYYEKPSQVRKIKKAMAIKREKKRLAASMPAPQRGRKY
tara:strand:+ start:285 stop:581 length:297 start_codon:yes stop_codon:yes gene_type:complete